jgi:hypothetical protein
MLGKGAKASRIHQVGGQLFVGEVPVLLENSASQDLFGGHPQAPGLRVFQGDQIVVNIIQDLSVLIEKLRDDLEFPTDFRAREDVEDVRLCDPFSRILAPTFWMIVMEYQNIKQI